MPDISPVVLGLDPASIELSFRGHKAPKKSVHRTSISDFEAASVLQSVPFGKAAAAIRRHLHAYIGEFEQDQTTPSFELIADKLRVSAVSSGLDEAMAAARSILSTPLDPDDSLATPYVEDTLDRSVSFLRSLAELFWRDTGDYIPIPTISPAHQGSIDLFWEEQDLTLLINIPADLAKPITFFGRRFDSSKLSGTVADRDSEPRHLTGWLSSHE